MTRYDIFISYRREGGYDTAKHLYDLLTRDGYRVSFDIDTLRNGDFDTALLSRIDNCKDFILIVDKNCFNRILSHPSDPQQDWLRQELAYALEKKKNIIPIFLKGITEFPKGLPEDIKGVAQKNGPIYNRYYFNDFYKKLKDVFLTSKSKRYRALWTILFVSIILGTLLTSMSILSNTDKKNNSVYQNDFGYPYDYDQKSTCDTIKISNLKEVDPFHPFMRFFGPDTFTIGGRAMMEADEESIEIQISFNDKGDQVTGGYVKFLDSPSDQIIISSGYQNPREESGLILKGFTSYCDNSRIEISYIGEGYYEGVIDLCGVSLPFTAE